LGTTKLGAWEALKFLNYPLFLYPL
jgi:hypothetical protein